MTYRMTGKLAVGFIAVPALALAACSTTSSKAPDAGERISARGAAISQRGEAWTDGQNDVQKGQRLVDKSASRAAENEKKLRRAQEAIAKAEREIQMAELDKAEGERMIAGGRVQMQQAEAAYTDLRNEPSAATPR